ncbi:MAG: 50S ribosomal protein L6 [bacterium]
MSRIGKKPIVVRPGVKVRLGTGVVEVEGPKGKLSQAYHHSMLVKMDGDTITVAPPAQDKFHRSLHGLTRTLIANAITGVADGFTRTLEIHGVGYKAQTDGKKLTLTLGYSHPVLYDAPAGIKLEVKENTTVVVSGADRKMVGETAAKIRSFRPPEPYKGKGIKYQEEVIRRKAGKTAAS